MKELTIEELKQMPGQPVWCPEEEAYGIVMCDKIGQWAGIPFLHEWRMIKFTTTQMHTWKAT